MTNLESKEETDKMLEELFSIPKKKPKKIKKEEDIMREEIYTYKEMLDKLYQNIEDKDNMLSKQKAIIRQPIVHRVSSKRTGWINFKECCVNINRDPNHIQHFLEVELMCICSIDGNGFLIMKGIYQQKNIESILRKYINQFVQCAICKSIETNIRKDNVTRVSLLDCSSCKSSRSVNLNCKKLK